MTFRITTIIMTDTSPILPIGRIMPLMAFLLMLLLQYEDLEFISVSFSKAEQMYK